MVTLHIVLHGMTADVETGTAIHIEKNIQLFLTYTPLYYKHSKVFLKELLFVPHNGENFIQINFMASFALIFSQHHKVNHLLKIISSTIKQTKSLAKQS